MEGKVYTCPSCNGNVSFTHKETNQVQCTCGTVLRRDGEVLFEQKSVYVIQEPSDYIHIGTTGSWQGKPFRVTGRFRAWFTQSVFNYWTIVFNDGILGWLGEGYGLYSILLRTELMEPLSSKGLDSYNIATKRKWKDNGPYFIERVATCNKWEISGEVWMPPAGTSFRLVEAATGNEERVQAFEFAKDKIVAFDAFYVALDALGLQHVQDEERKAFIFSCSGCKHSIAVKTYPYAQSCSCANCGAQYALKSQRGFEGTGHFNRTDAQPVIPLGTRGMLQGIHWEVIGFSLKEENNSYASQWREYTLYNKAHGFAFLSEFDGHWILVKERGDAPVVKLVSAVNITYEKEPFQLYNRYSYTVINAKGEFPYNIYRTKETEVKEFISPPEVWIREWIKREEINWFWGTHIDGAEVEKAFPMPAGLPVKVGVGAIEPKNFISPVKIAAMYGAAAAILIFLHLVFTGMKQERVLHEQTHRLPDTTNVVNIVTEKLVLDKSSSNLEFKIEAPVDNSWFSLEGTLVNAHTGTEYGFEQGVEYYHGYEDGENWNEGSKSKSAYLTSIPAGTYFLQLKGVSEARATYGIFQNSTTPNIDAFHLQVKYDVPTHRNLFFSLLLLAIWPIIKFINVNRTESLRWQNSPFSPYTYEED